MPEFHMPAERPVIVDGNPVAFSALDDVTAGFIEALFFTSTGTADDEDLEIADFGDLSAASLTDIQARIAAFVVRHWDDIGEVEDNGRIDGYGAREIGRDIYYTSSGSGVGFWSRNGFDECRAMQRLDRAARSFGNVDLYRGDNGQLYV